MSFFLSICLLLVATLGHGYLWTDAVNWLHAWSGSRKLIDFLSLACFVAFLAIPLVIVFRWRELIFFTGRSADSSFDGLHAYLLLCGAWGVYAIVRNGLYDFVTDNPRVLIERKQEIVDTSEVRDAALLRAGFPQLLGKLPGNQILQLVVEHKTLAIPRLSAEHEGLRIAHISDLHLTGRIAKEWYEFVVEQVNELAADAIIITGDIVEDESCWPWLADTLGKLHAKNGVFFILGNHDFYIDTDKTKALLEGQGLVCLSQRWAEVDWNGAPVILAGNELPWAPQAADMSTLPSLENQDRPLRLMLLHSPDQFSWACDNDADLALAGHTHGGQLRFPLLGPIVSPSRYGTRFACGVFQRVNTVMHVTRGIAGKTPLRWNCPPEIAILELDIA